MQINRDITNLYWLFYQPTMPIFVAIEYGKLYFAIYSMDGICCIHFRKTMESELWTDGRLLPI